MKNTPHEFSSEIRIPLQPVLVVLIIIACIILFVASEVVMERTISMVFSGVLASISILLWQWENTQPLLSRWLTVLLVLVSILFWGIWQRIPEVLFLLVIPTALAAAFINVRACVASAFCTSLVIGGMYAFANRTGLIINHSTAAISLVALWGLVGVLLAIYLPIEKLALWAWHYYSEAQVSVEQARDSKVELSQSVENLEYANRQLALLNERATALRWVAEEAQQAKSAFVARVSHEFRTPLNIIIGMVNLLVENPEVYETPPSGKALDHLHVVYRNCQHLASMINDVLALSQAQAGRITLHRSYVQLEGIIKAASDIVHPLITEKQLAFHTMVPDELPLVYCDQTRIRQILLNLLSNAARLTQHGSITVQVQTGPRQVVISVRDTGPGISAEEVERIFEPFFQGSVIPWQDNKGTGLGLSISRQFVALHGGRMWVESELGVGSTFFIELPVEPLPELVSSPTRWIREDWEWRERQNRPSFPDSHYRPRVVVWHESDVLAEHYSWTSDTVEWLHVTSEEAVINEVARGMCRALLVNVSAPQLVWQAAERARLQFPDIPVLGCSFSYPPNPLIDAGAQEYLIKPLTHTQLKQAIDSVGRAIRHVLVLDDDVDSRALLATFLQVYDSGIKVTAVGTGSEAFAVMQNELVDLLLLDLLLKDEHGFDILTRMQREYGLADIPVIMVTAQDSSAEVASTPLLLVTMGSGLGFNQLTDAVTLLAELITRADGV